MIVQYKNEYFEYFYNNITEFNVDYLNKKDPFSNSYVYLLDGSPVALISYSLIYDRIELDYIWVNSLFRNNNIATILLEYILKIPNIRNITLEVCINNYPAICLYKKMGFKIAAIRKKYYKNKDGYLMIRELM